MKFGSFNPSQDPSIMILLAKRTLIESLILNDGKYN